MVKRSCDRHQDINNICSRILKIGIFFLLNFESSIGFRFSVEQLKIVSYLLIC